VKLFLDIETDTAHSHIWCCFTWDEENGYVCHTKATTLKPLIEKCETVIGHNLIGFDGPVLRKCWNISIAARKARDTLILSRLYNPNIEGGHSLKEWGKRVGRDKIDYPEAFAAKTLLPSNLCFDQPDLALLLNYCRNDVEVLRLVDDHLQKALDKEGFSQQSIELEHQVAIIVKKQEEHGFKLDVKKAQGLLAALQGKMVDIENNLQAVFPPIVTERWSEKTGKRLKDNVQVFNPGSRQQIAERLSSLGVVFTKQTEKGSTIVDEKVLEGINLPEAKLLSEYLMLQKRVAQVSSWLEELKEDGRVHGRVITNGAVTGRMTHSSPNMAQIPNSGSPYGPECRDLWMVENGNVLVGCDASGLELRMLAHYMKDEEYVRVVTEGSSKDGTDVHTVNQRAAGLATRDNAKTFIYAFLYGAGDAKIGSIVGGSARDGAALKEKFLKQTPALARLLSNVSRYAAKGWVPGLDGRKIWVRSEHAALNSLLQGAGAIVMKQALVLLDKKLRKHKVSYGFCANVHDEWQIETTEDKGELVGKLAVESMKEAGELLGLRCPISGEYNIGRTWKETH
jgi:DNA polymerase I-like protein with 3'-5' exonuclease and polymerase domains